MSWGTLELLRVNPFVELSIKGFLKIKTAPFWSVVDLESEHTIAGLKELCVLTFVLYLYNLSTGHSSHSSLFPPLFPSFKKHLECSFLHSMYFFPALTCMQFFWFQRMLRRSKIGWMTNKDGVTGVFTILQYLLNKIENISLICSVIFYLLSTDKNIYYCALYYTLALLERMLTF